MWEIRITATSTIHKVLQCILTHGDLATIVGNTLSGHCRCTRETNMYLRFVEVEVLTLTHCATKKNSPPLEPNQNVPVLERLYERRVHCQSHVTRSLAECVHVGGRSTHYAAGEIPPSV